LIIGWGNFVKILSLNMQFGRNLKIDVISDFILQYSICGIIPHNDFYLVLSYDDEEYQNNKNKNFEAPIPKLRIINIKGEEISCDGIDIKEYKKYIGKDYRLEYNGYEKVYYILSKSNIVVAKERTLEDKIVWLCSKLKFQEALDLSKSNEGKISSKYSILKIGKKI
jgi:hypothetical protein